MLRAAGIHGDKPGGMRGESVLIRAKPFRSGGVIMGPL